MDEDSFILLDTGPDLKFQLEWNGLVPRREKAGDSCRESRIMAVLITHGHGDHTSGIAEFSTGKSFMIPIYGSQDIIHFLFGVDLNSNYFGNLGRLGSNYVVPHILREDKEIELNGIKIKGFEIEHTQREGDISYPTNTFGYELVADDNRFIYTPDLGSLSEELLERVEGSDLFMLDGTFWWDDELSRVSGISVTSRELGHVPMEDSIGIMDEMDITRVVYTHFNHTNPINDPRTSQSKMIKEKGYLLGYDGMKITI
jgi:pyrroloquinoline quinone biosynthesis protein B